MGFRATQARLSAPSLLTVLLSLWLNPLFVSADEHSKVTNIRFVSPAPDSIFHPGDKVTVELELLNGVSPDKVLVMPDFRSGAPAGVEMQEFDGPPYRYSFRLSDGFVGTVGLNAIEMSRDAPDEGSYAELTLMVVPEGKPWGIGVGLRAQLLDVKPADEPRRQYLDHEAQISVTGYWANSVRSDLTPASHGTSYESLDTSIVEVSKEGLVSAGQPGYTFVKVVNDAHEELLFVGVLGENGNLPEQDQSANLDIEYGPLRYNGRLVQPVTIRNNSSMALPRLSVKVPEKFGMAYHISVHDDDVPWLLEPGKAHTFYLRFTEFGQSATRVPVRIVTE